MSPILIGSIAAGALCALVVIVAIARHLRRQNATQTLVYDIQQQRWVPADDYRLGEVFNRIEMRAFDARHNRWNEMPD